MTFDSELFCQEIFDGFLRENCHLKNLSWRRVPKGEDPPDFYLTIETTCFAVEVTSTEVMREVTLGEGKIREYTYETSHTNLVKEVGRKAQDLGLLSGLYIVGFRQPITDQNFRKVKKDLLEKLLTYIRQTQHLIAAPDEVILYHGQTICRIEKIRGSVTGVFEAFSDTAWLESPENKNRICDMLQTAVTTKKEKLAQNGQTAPKILLLLNTYHFAEPKIYKNCISKGIQDLEFFHTVFLIHNGKGFPLYTSDPEWSKHF